MCPYQVLALNHTLKPNTYTFTHALALSDTLQTTAHRLQAILAKDGSQSRKQGSASVSPLAWFLASAFAIAGGTELVYGYAQGQRSVHKVPKDHSRGVSA